MLERDLLLRKLADLERYLAQVSEYRSVTVEQYRAATYAEAFEVLAEAGLLDAAQREVMVRMAGFRNVVVHEYARIDPEIVVRVLRDHLDDLVPMGRSLL